MNALIEFLKGKTKEKETIKDTLKKMTNDFERVSCSTHIGKYTNPDIKVNILYTSKDSRKEYLHTGTLEYDMPDIVIDGGAAYMPAAKTVYIKLDDGISVYDHIKNSTGEIKKIIEDIGGDFEEIRRNLIEIKKDDDIESDYRLRQVYFPVAGSYHLLTIVPSSVLINEMKLRNDRFMQDIKEIDIEKSNEYDLGFKKLTDIHHIKYGGANPVNVSLFNSNRNGKAILLLSAPPVYDNKDKTPVIDVFKYYRMDKSKADHLNKLLLTKWNNIAIRNAIRNSVEVIVDDFIRKMLKYQGMEAGWSNNEKCSLPDSQKIWLDKQNSEKRIKESDWRKEIIRDFSKAFVRSFEKEAGKNSAIIDDDLYILINKCIEDAL